MTDGDTVIAPSSMNRILAASLVLALPVFTALAAACLPAAGQEPAVRGPSGLPLPRFVSIKASLVNLRVGPSRGHAVKWVYVRRGTPMEIIGEYDHWRQVRDQDGAEGWIHKALLSGKRTAVVSPWQRGESETFLLMRERPAPDAMPIARMEPGVVVRVHECADSWCRVQAAGGRGLAARLRGWVAQNALWGVYPGEAFR